MRTGFIVSVSLHAVLVAALVIDLPFGRRDDLTPPPPIAVTVVDVSELTQLANNDPVPDAEETVPEPQVAQAEPEPAPERAPERAPEPAPPPPEPAPAPEPAPVTTAAPDPAPPAPPPPEPEPEVAALPPPEPEALPEPAPEESVDLEPDIEAEPVTVAALPVPLSKPEPPPPAPQPQTAQEVSPKPPPERERPSFLSNVQAALRDVDRQTEQQVAPPASDAAQQLRARYERQASAIQVQTRGTADRLTISQIDALRRHISERWNIDAGAAGIREMVVEVSVTLGQDRRVADVEITDSLARYKRDPAYRAFADRALRAVRAASPLTPLPPAQAPPGMVITIRFSPTDLF